MPPRASSKRPTRGADGAGEGAALVAEELALDEGRREGGAVDVHEGPARAGRCGVELARGEPLPGARLAEEEHRALRRRHAGDLTAHAGHRLRLAGEKARLRVDRDLAEGHAAPP